MTAASIPSRRSLNVQLGPAVEDDSSTAEEFAEELLLRRPARRTPRQQPPARIRWSRMAAPPGQPPAAPPPPLEPPLPLALLPASSAGGAASLCQLVDFGETRDLIRRQREAAKQVEEVGSIVSHLSLDRDDAQNARQRSATNWATFRTQPNSQFKQYVFQSPSRNPVLAAGDGEDQHRHRHVDPHDQQLQSGGLQRSRTTLGLVSGRPVVRQSRPEPLGAGALRRSEFQTSLSREATQLTGRPTGIRLQQGYSSSVLDKRQQQQQQPGDSLLYRQFAHRKSKSFRLA